jgi:hypothetical protein
MRVMTKDIVAPPGGVMTDEVGVVTGELTLATEVAGDKTVILKVQYKGADEWYKVTDAEIQVDDPAKLAEAEEQLISRFT